MRFTERAKQLLRMFEDFNIVATSVKASSSDSEESSRSGIISPSLAVDRGFFWEFLKPGFELSAFRLLLGGISRWGAEKLSVLRTLFY